MTAFKGALSRFLGIFSIILFTVLVLVTTWQVVSRQALNDPSTWSEELSKILFVWLSFVGSAFLFGERGHIAVDYLARRFPAPVQKVLASFVQLVILFFALVAMVWGGYLAASIAWTQNLTALPLTIGWVYVVIPVAGVFVAVFALIDLVAVLTGREAPYPDIDESDDQPMNLEDAAAESRIILDEGTRK